MVQKSIDSLFGEDLASHLDDPGFIGSAVLSPPDRFKNDNNGRPDTPARFSNLKRFSQSLYERAMSSEKLQNMPDDEITITGLTKDDLIDKLEKLKNCANEFQIDEYSDESERVHGKKWCSQPWGCSICSARLQGRRRAVLEGDIKTAAYNHPYAYMVTFTIESGRDLYEQFRKLKKAIREMRRKGQLRNKLFKPVIRKEKSELVDGINIKTVYSNPNDERIEQLRSGGELGKVAAGIMAHETKVGAISGKYHIHTHSLFFTDKPLDFAVYDQEKKMKLEKQYGYRNIPESELDKIKLNEEGHSKISKEWNQVSGGSNIDVKPIYHIPPKAKGRERAMFKRMSYEDSVIHQAKEVIKYLTKFTDFENDTLFETPQGNMIIDIMSECIGKVRHFSTLGEFRLKEKDRDQFHKHGPDYMFRSHKYYSVDSGTYTSGFAKEIQKLDEDDEFEAQSKTAIALSEYLKTRRKIGERAARLTKIELMDRHITWLERIRLKMLERLRTSKNNFYERCKSIYRIAKVRSALQIEKKKARARYLAIPQQTRIFFA